MTEGLGLLGFIPGLRKASERPNIALALFAPLRIHRWAQRVQE